MRWTQSLRTSRYLSITPEFRLQFPNRHPGRKVSPTDWAKPLAGSAFPDLCYGCVAVKLWAICPPLSPRLSQLPPGGKVAALLFGVPPIKKRLCERATNYGRGLHLFVSGFSSKHVRQNPQSERQCYFLRPITD